MVKKRHKNAKNFSPIFGLWKSLCYDTGMKSTFLHFRIVFLVIGVIVTASAYMTVFWATFPSYSADALERFHREQNRQIFELLPIQQDVLGDLFASESKINHFERIYDRVDASIDQTLEQKMMATNAKHSLENSITQSKKHLQSWEELKKKSQKEIAQINEELLKIANNIESLWEEIEKNKKQIKQYIVKTYTNNQWLFIDEQKHVNVLHTLFQNTDNIASGIIQQNNSKILSHVGHAMLAKNKDYLHSQSEMRKNMSELKEKKLMHKFRIKELTKNTEISLAYQEKLNKIAKKKQSILNENHLKNKKLESDILIEVQALREEYDQKIHTIRELNNCEQSDNDMCHYVDMYYFAEKKLRDQYLGRDEASFRWPVDISRGFSATFRDRDYFQTLGATHYGVDVRVPQGSDIIAPEDGYVLYLNPPTPYNYSYLALKHPDGYVTVYGHLSETFVSRFEFVQAGDIIAKSWGALGTPWAGSITSGPHLHFEMYHEKKSVDPMRHISIAELPKEHIPKKYRYKYYLDLKENKPKTNPRSLKKSIHLLHFKDNKISSKNMRHHLFESGITG